ncbi:type VI secretion system tip protein VgrG [Taylorella equigenitalis]|uniref:type VI secretion system tip protein TssI/VgrG n=2 Tax=Taylorella equigenitalis TaxID=29575 RepID=UPI00237D24E8|nr:type VI secretion system tip protein TssI/VgrG [Taylorella equigenitalis]WDU49223.1 type VI secretion system tip protein VgrG [Taylorella equigenitalis]
MNRIVNLKTIFGDSLRFLSLKGKDELSNLFEYRVQAVAEDKPIDQTQLLGTDVSIEIDTEKSLRYINGMISSVRKVSEKIEDARKYFIYEFTVVPHLWYSTQTNNSRIFQEMTAVDVVKKVLEDYDVYIENKLFESYRKWNYCVQYNETDFSFVSRLLEHEGIYYWFRHDDKKHYLVLTDSKDTHPKLPVNGTAYFYHEDKVAYAHDQHVFDWQSGGQITSSSYSTQDYNFENPRGDLSGESNVGSKYSAGRELDIYEPFGGYISADESEHYAKVHLESLQALQDYAEARTRLRDLASGYKIELKQAPYAADDGEYLVVKTEYDISVQSYVSGDDVNYNLQTSALLIPADVQYRAPRIHKEPKMGGPQTAVVTGPAGEEIWTDKYGRIKVQFHWDRDGKRDENSSCWVRVSSPWAGSGFGGVQIPRVGEEVVVDFVDGQPDRPVVIGRVYNNENMPPVNLPDDATQSGFFTRSKNGDASNANRMMFEDSPGNELLSFVAERDMNTHVKDKQTQTIDGNVTSSISSFRSHTTHSTSDVTLKSGREAKYESDHERLIKTQLTEKIGGNLKEDYLDGVDETIKGTFTSTVSGVATHTMLGYHLNSETSDEEEVTGDVVQSVGVDEIFNINTKSKLNTGSLSWKTPKLGIESKSSSTKIDSASNVDVSAIFGYTMQTEASITNKAPLKFEFELLSSKNKITHVNDVSTSISLTGVKGSVGAQTLGLNVIYLSGVVQNNSKQYFSVGASGISGQLIGKENKDGSLATDLVGLRFNRGLKVWFSGPDSGGGSGKGGSGKGKSDKKEGGGDDKGGKDKNKKSDEPSADCKECKGLSSSKILLAPVVGMAVDGIVDIGMDLASGAVSQATSPHSIDFSLGEERFYHTDFALPGIKKISWTRMYRSNNYAFDQQSVLSPLGPRWMTPYMQFIYLHEETPVFVNFEGRLVRCPQQLSINKEIYDRNEELFWSQVDPDTLQIRYKNDNKLIFKKIGSVFRLHLCTDAQNNILKLDYDDESRLSNLENDLYNLYFRYDDQNRFDEVYYYETDLETGNKVEVVLAKYSYDADGNLITATDRYALSNKYKYQSNHLITRYEDKTARGVNLSWEIDGSHGRCVHESLDDGSEALYIRYERKELSTYVTDALGQTTKYVFNEDNYLMQIHYCDGTKRINERDKYNNITQVRYQDGTTSKFVYDAFDNLVEVLQPDNTSIRYDYDLDNNLITLTDPMGYEWHRTYNNLKLVESEIDPLGHVTKYQYNTKGQVIRIQDAKGGNKHILYHPTGEVASFRDCSGKTTKWDYDLLGRVVKMTEPCGTTEVYTYDYYSNICKVERSGTNPVYLEHDAEGRLLKFIDGLDRETRYEYNPAGRIETRIDALNHEVGYRYDVLGRLSKLINENNDKYLFEYDQLSRLVYERGFDGKEKRYQVNKLTGRLDSVTFVDQTLSFQYDIMGRMTKTSSADEVREYDYDLNGRLTLAKNPTSENQFELDALGNVLREIHSYDIFDHHVTKLWRFEYDELSNLIKTVRPDGKEVDYLRYGSGHLHGMLLDKERIVDYERDDNHREVKRHWAQDMLQTTAYDAAGRLANQHTQSGKYVKKSILNRDYQYDGANQLINIKDSRKGELSYRYDPIGRLINAKGPLGEETFSFDPAHNILSKEHSALSTYHHQTENTLPKNVSKVMGNLLRHISGSHFDYDQRGNLIKKESAKGIQTFDWDGFNQMKSSTFRGARAGSRLDTQYRYDVFGRRIGKRVVDVRTKEVLEQTLYDWDGLTIASEDRIGEQLAVQAQIRKDAGSETRKLSSEVQYLYEDGEFVPLVQYTNTAAVGFGSGGAGSFGGGSKGVAPAIYHYVNDQIGTPQILMNAEQEVVWEVQSKAWGDTIISAPASDDGVINNHRFQGQYFDAESELHYNTFRYYDPEIGRFISLDPIGLLGGLNNYQYAPNPVEWVDPWGLSYQSVTFPPNKVIKEVVIKLQGSRGRDFAEANKLAELFGKSGNATRNAHRLKYGDVTWHHVDYNPVTNEAKMQLVTTADHEATYPHSGSVSEYEKHHGVKYDTREAKQKADELNKGKCTN